MHSLCRPQVSLALTATTTPYHANKNARKNALHRLQARRDVLVAHYTARRSGVVLTSLRSQQTGRVQVPVLFCTRPCTVREQILRRPPLLAERAYDVGTAAQAPGRQLHVVCQEVVHNLLRVQATGSRAAREGACVSAGWKRRARSAGEL